MKGLRLPTITISIDRSHIRKSRPTIISRVREKLLLLLFYLPSASYIRASFFARNMQTQRSHTKEPDVFLPPLSVVVARSLLLLYSRDECARIISLHTVRCVLEKKNIERKKPKRRTLFGPLAFAETTVETRVFAADVFEATFAPTNVEEVNDNIFFFLFFLKFFL